MLMRDENGKINREMFGMTLDYPYLCIKNKVMMKEECLICQAPLEYLEREELMECELCHRQEMSKTRCVNGHYVCNECHTKGLDSVVGYCMKETSINPIEILERMMDMSFCHTHGPEHHTLVGAALLTAYHNAGGEIELLPALKEMLARASKVPGGACGFWGSCGAAISSGMFLSIISGATPLSKEPWGQANMMTGKALLHIGEVGGPRCCKRNSYLSIQSAVQYVKELYSISMEMNPIVCSRHNQNNQCIGKRCPFHP